MFGILSYKSWLIEPGFAQRMAPIILRALHQATIENFFQEGRESQDKMYSALYNGVEAETLEDERNRSGPIVPVVTAKNGKKVAVILMAGAITKNGDMCSYGMRTHQNSMAKIAKRDDIAAVVYHFNNAPGGTVDGTPEMGANIFDYSKATVSFVDGYAASAHYWIASQTNHIMMNKLTPSEVGSIGAFVLSQNVQNMIDAGQIPSMEIIRAPQSENKALFNVIEPVTKEIRSGLEADLQDTVKNFIGNVKKGRAAAGATLSNSKEIFTGLMYGTDEAIANGLADSKGTLMDAINKAASLAASKSLTAPLKPAKANTNMKFKSQWLSNLLGKSEKAAETPTVEAEQPSMEATDAKVAELETEAATLKADNEAQKTKITELESQITALNGQVTTLTSEKETLSTEKADLQKKVDEAPTGKETTIISKEEKDALVSTDPVEAKKSFRSQADEEADAYVNASRATLK